MWGWRHCEYDSGCAQCYLINFMCPYYLQSRCAFSVFVKDKGQLMDMNRARPQMFNWPCLG